MYTGPDRRRQNLQLPPELGTGHRRRTSIRGSSTRSTRRPCEAARTSQHRPMRLLPALRRSTRHSSQRKTPSTSSSGREIEQATKTRTSSSKKARTSACDAGRRGVAGMRGPPTVRLWLQVHAGPCTAPRESSGSGPAGIQLRRPSMLAIQKQTRRGQRSLAELARCRSPTIPGPRPPAVGLERQCQPDGTSRTGMRANSAAKITWSVACVLPRGAARRSTRQRA